MANLNAKKSPIKTTFEEYLQENGNEAANELLSPEVQKVAREMIKEKIKAGELNELVRSAKFHAKIK